MTVTQTGTPAVGTGVMKDARVSALYNRSPPSSGNEKA